MYSGYRINSISWWRLMEVNSWNFGNDCVMNVVTFVVDNSWSSHSDNLINQFLVLFEGLT